MGMASFYKTSFKKIKNKDSDMMGMTSFYKTSFTKN